MLFKEQLKTIKINSCSTYFESKTYFNENDST